MSKGAASWLLLVLGAVVVGWVLSKRRPPVPFVVIGEQLAQAGRAEQARLSKPNVGPSPLPPARYDRALGDFDLTDPTKRPLDDELSTLCQRFAASDPAGRSRMRDSASMDDFYTLLTFSRRSAVFGLQDRNPQHVVDGLTAVAMLDYNRIDFRDASIALPLLHHAARAIGADVVHLFGDAASIASPQMSEVIIGFLKRSEEGRDIQKSWGYAVVETKAGAGFVNSGFNPYHPSRPLDKIGLALDQLLRRDKYQPASVTLATDLPAVWLSSVDDAALQRALKSIRGTITVQTELRPQQTPDYQYQMLIIFLAELESESAVASLVKLSREKKARSQDPAMLSASEGRLFCLVIARSVMVGKPSFETHASLQRFADGIAAALR